MNPADRDKAVKELQAAMRARLEVRTLETSHDDDAAILLFSKVIVALKGHQAIPAEPAMLALGELAA